MDINDLLNQAKERANLNSDYALAKVLGVKTGHISEFRNGKRHPSNEDAVKLATLAGLDEMQVIAFIEYQTANTEKKKDFWKHYIESRGITATLGICVLGLTIIATPEPAQANVLHLQNYNAPFFQSKQSSNIHYAYWIKKLSGVIQAPFPPKPKKNQTFDRLSSLL